MFIKNFKLLEASEIVGKCTSDKYLYGNKYKIFIPVSPQNLELWNNQTLMVIENVFALALNSSI